MAKKSRTRRRVSQSKQAAKPIKDKSKPLRIKRPVLLALGIFFVLMAVFFFETIFNGKTYLSPDAQAPASFSQPLAKALWEDGVYPHWMPYLFGGMPSFASMSYTPFAYFPDAIYEVVNRVIPIRRWLIYALHYMLAGLGVFLFLRRKGADFIPALTGGFAFMLMPYLITMIIFGHGSQIMTAAYIPLAFWAVDRLLEKFSLLNIGVAALILGFMLQRGHVQIAYYGLMFVGFYLFYRIFMAIRSKETKRLLPMIGGFAAALVLALGLSAMLFLPLQEYTPYSIRGAASVLNATPGQTDTGVGFDYATQWSFSPGEMMTFLIPSFYGFGGFTYWGDMPFTDYPNYMGILVLALAITALVQRVPLSGFLGVTILLALLISFGRHFEFFYKLFYNFFPFFNKFRVPVMMLVLVQCCVAMLAGLGLHSILKSLKNDSSREDEEQRALTTRRLWIALGVIFGVVILLTFAKSGFQEFMQGVYPDRYDQRTQLQVDTIRFNMLFRDLWIMALILGGGVATLALTISRKVSLTFASIIFAVLILVDLWLVDKRIGNDPIPEQSFKATLQPDEATRFLQQDSTVFRIFPAVELFDDLRWAAHGIESVGGYHAAKPRRYQDLIQGTNLNSGLANDYFRTINQGGRRAVQPLPIESVPLNRRLANQRLLDLLNVKYLLSFHPLPEPNWVLRTNVSIPYGGNVGRLSIYENTTALPRAVLVGEYEVEADNVKALSRLRSGDFDPHKTVLLAEEPSLKPQPDSTARAEIKQYSLHEISIETESQSPQILVLSDNYYPIGWHAYIDGQPVKTLLANYSFRGIEVPAGKHVVQFRYSSGAFTTGVYLSLGALALSFGFIFWGWRKERASGQSGDDSDK